MLEKLSKVEKSLLESGHLIGIKTHNIDINIRYCFVRGNCCPEQRISNTNHDVWVCLHKDSGKIINAGYTCVDG